MTLNGATILITGGSGFFAQHFVRYVLDHHHPHSIRLYSRSEAVQAALQARYDDHRLRFLIGDVRDAERLSLACRGADYAVHAAALKRVETCEADPNEAVLTNVLGTMHMARACLERGVQKAVFLSTDKAASPCTLYGATKLCAERLWVQSNSYSAGTKTQFVATRYGNVLGSTGSVVPVWREQARTGTISMSDPTVSRFWMAPADAVALVDCALQTAHPGEVLIPKCGAATLGWLKEAVAPEAHIRLTGFRPGEKQHETLISDDETRYAEDCGTHWVLQPVTTTWTTAPLDLPTLIEPYYSDTAPQLTVAQLREMIA